MYKGILLKLLDDGEVQQKILSIVRAEPSKVDRHLDEVRSEVNRLELLLKEQQSELNALRTENARLEREKSSLQETLRRMREESAQRFERGWELFKQYRNVSEHSRQILRSGVFTRDDDFMSFICGGAQTGSLETLWDSTRECVLKSRQQDAGILWEIFEYCIELVNSSRVQAQYSILTVDEGDRFDSDVHTEGPKSRAQGKVIGVYLPGYRNNYNGRIMRKSIVQVG